MSKIEIKLKHRRTAFGEDYFTPFGNKVALICREILGELFTLPKKQSRLPLL